MSKNSPDNILLYLPEKQEQHIREIFAGLADRGFPVQNQRPHITVTFSAAMDPSVVERLPRKDVPGYLQAMDELTSSHFKELTAVEAAYWRPKTQEKRLLAGG